MAKKQHKKNPKIIIRQSDYGGIGFVKENKGLHDVIQNSGERFLDVFPVEKDTHLFHHTYSYMIGELRSYLRLYIDLFCYLDISSNDVSSLEQSYWSLSNPDANRDKERFKLVFEGLLHALSITDVKITERLELLSRIECIRLDEAMNCQDFECNLSSVVMSVSAVENRLHKLLSKKNKTIYKKDFEKSTLGGIIALFRKDAYLEKKYQPLKKILPDKHKPLMEMLNIYRIFSAHPKDVVITNQTAKSILSLSFLFLIDKDLKV